LDDPDDLKNDIDYPYYAAPETLEVGNEIEFVAPEGTAGLSRWLRRATIIGFTPDSPTSPLVLHPFHVLSWDYQITRLSPSKTTTGPIRCDSTKVTRRIEEFVFRGELGVQNRATSLIKAGKRARIAQKEIQKAADAWWQSSTASSLSSSSSSSTRKENKRTVRWVDTTATVRCVDSTKKQKVE
jgi:hypothetical protein